MKKNISFVTIKIGVSILVIFGVGFFRASSAQAIVSEGVSAYQAGSAAVNLLSGDENAVVEPKCPSGQTFTKPSPGIGPRPCGANQCREKGYLYFTACVTQSDCLQLGGTTDSGNKANCVPEGGSETYCCRILKNRCFAESEDPNSVNLCTTKQDCEKVGGKIKGTGFGCMGEFNTCCILPDSPKAPMKIIGEPLLKGTTVDPTGTGGGITGGAYTKAQRASEHIDNFCFTQTECSTSGGKFEKGNGCPFKGDQAQGYCVAPEPEYELQNPVFGATKISGLRNFIGLIFNGSIGVLLIVSAIFFIWGSFKYLVSSIAKSIEKAKNTMVDSLVGLALGLGAFAILANVNPNLLTLNPGKIYMINRMNFYNVVYCNDLVDKNVKLMNAGTPTAPLSYSAQLKAVGFKESIADAKCGQEYFIDGADSTAVCMGQACGNGGGMCINCSTGLGKSCASNSTVEHACADCHFGGNIVVGSTFEPEKVWLYLFCDRGGNDIESESIAEFGKIKTDDSTKRATESASGNVTNFCFEKSDFDMNSNQIKDFEKTCKSEGGKNMGMAMFAFIDNEFAGSPLTVIESIKRQKQQNPYQTIFQRLIALNALPAYFLMDSNTDNSYYFMNKNSCNTNLFATSMSYNQGLVNAFLTTEETAFEDMMEDFMQKTPSGYEEFLKGVWTIDEAVEIVEKGTKSPCGFDVQ